MKKIMVSAGEVSGDMHAAYLIHALKKLLPDACFFGLGSEKLRAEGVEILADITRRGSVGIFETLPHVLPVLSLYRKMVRILEKERPSLLLLVDSQGLNLMLGAAAKKLGIKTAYYIAPQEWLWGTMRGVKKVSQTIDLIISIFEREHQIYKQGGANSVYFGHPLIDIVKPTLSKEETLRQLVGHTAGPLICLCPGSRTQEIRNLLPILLKAGEKIQQTIPQAQFVIPASSTNFLDELKINLGNFAPKVIVGHNYDLLAAADLAICASGTINTETAILGTPNIMVYTLSRGSYLLGKYLFKIDKKIAYFSMPNILLNEGVIPELVMKNANPDKIAMEALGILQNPKRQEKMKEAFGRLRTKLGSPGVINRCAQAISVTVN